MMFRSALALGIAIVALAACQPPQQEAAKTPEAAPPTSSAPATPKEPLDPFVVAIDAGRWSVIIDKAMDGARQADVPTAGVDVSDLYRADQSLKSAAASLIELRNQVCGQGLVTGAACELKDWPAWTREPPTDKTPIEELDRRSQWLGEVMQPFTDAGCEAGRKASKDEMFCSVE